MKDTATLFSLFTTYAYAKSYAAAFEEILNYFLIPFRYYNTKEEQVAALTKLTAHTNREAIVALLSEIGELSEGFCDPIGDLYERLISKGQNAQIFTPEPIACFMAASVIHENMQPGEKVCDPACGSGRMLLAVAKINRHLRFYGADIDPICAKMTVVNMLLNSLTGEIAHMDSLSNDFYWGYKTGTMLKDGYHYPCFYEFTDPEESYMWLKPPAKQPTKPSFDTPFNPVKSEPMNGVQGTLF